MEKKMNTKSIAGIARYMILGLLLLVTACSPRVPVGQPTSLFPSPTSLPAITSTSTLEPTAIPTAQPTVVPTTVVPTDPPAATSAPVITGCQDSAQYISD